MRQAYDYWQNQPGNYRVCRPEGRQRPKAPESSLVTAARGFYTFRRAEPSSALPAGPVAPRKAFRFPTLGFPGLPSAAASPEGCCGLGAHGGGPRPLRLPRGLQQRVVSPDVLSFSTSQWPAIHRAQCPQQPRWYASGWLKDLVPATRVIPDASRGSPITNFLFRGFVRRRLHAGEATVVGYQDQVRRFAPQLCPTLSGRAALLPSHIPSEGVFVGRTPDRARGSLFIFRKILNYGKF